MTRECHDAIHDSQRRGRKRAVAASVTRCIYGDTLNLDREVGLDLTKMANRILGEPLLRTETVDRKNPQQRTREHQCPFAEMSDDFLRRLVQKSGCESICKGARRNLH